MRHYMAGIAAAVLAASAARADPGGGHGPGNGGGNGGGNGKSNGHAAGPPAHGNSKGNGPARQAMKPAGHGQQGPAPRQQRAPQADARPGKTIHAGKPDKAPHDVNKQAWKSRPGHDEPVQHASAPGTSIRAADRTRHFDWASLDRSRRTIEGCPPGLAKKGNGCMPPGQARKAWYQPGWYGASWSSPDYRYYDGYMVRLGRGERVLSYVPLLGGALSVGRVWPSEYAPVALPAYYVDYYDLGPVGTYRYFDDTIYGIDPESAAITTIVALLTGEDIAIGQPMPAGYEIYNVPAGYRDRYVDGPDALYRYSDGYVYRLDPATRLVQAAIELLT